MLVAATLMSLRCFLRDMCPSCAGAQVFLCMQVATLAFVYPCLLAIYFGEAAYLAAHPEHYAQAFYKAIPERLFWPAFVNATAASLVGWQSVITSACRVRRRSARLHCFPPLKARLCHDHSPVALHSASNQPMMWRLRLASHPGSGRCTVDSAYPSQCSDLAGLNA